MKPISFPKVGFHQFWIQLNWTFWAIGIFLVVHVIRYFFKNNADSFYSAGYIAGNIYMLVIGIIAISFLSYYVGNGITRKNYFLGNMLAAVGLSIIIPILFYLINLVEQFIITRFTNIALEENPFKIIEIDTDGHLIGDIVQSIIITPFVSVESSFFLSLGLFALNLFMFYIIGWLIGAAFYRLGVILGIIVIIIGAALFIIKDTLIRLTLDIPIFDNFVALEKIPQGLALPVVCLVFFIIMLLIYLLIKRAPIKI